MVSRMKKKQTQEIKQARGKKKREEKHSSREYALDVRESQPMYSKSAPSSPNKLTFIDLFAGIGGIRLGMERAGCECVFSSEWDEEAAQTYEAYFGEKRLFGIGVFLCSLLSLILLAVSCL